MVQSLRSAHENRSLDGTSEFWKIETALDLHLKTLRQVDPYPRSIPKTEPRASLLEPRLKSRGERKREAQGVWLTFDAVPNLKDFGPYLHDAPMKSVGS